MQFRIDSDQQMQALGAQLAAASGGRGLIYLDGDLGTGKTTLVRGLIRALGHDGAVKSPTFTLVEPYQLGEKNIYHFDLYRLSDPEELEYMGLRDYFDGESLCLVEWPEKGSRLLPPPDLLLKLLHDGTSRDVTVSAGTEAGESMLKSLKPLKLDDL
ncbi:MAG: tRNA (adenosine(37)-N6)-threonylcarbamoyltransferase complex ATPase subunit type 1 TsaE [Sulfuriflexus sp.]|nr:tRNA (adenosine(37)-N6)-threonylcarbamoyltransferase complex ATPase subunit type 1 TsaE [Sulfuriflexus sp.]